jgi:hypothetical protein
MPPVSEQPPPGREFPWAEQQRPAQTPPPAPAQYPPAPAQTGRPGQPPTKRRPLRTALIVVGVLILVLAILNSGEKKQTPASEELVPNGLLDQYVSGASRRTIGGRDGFAAQLPVEPQRVVSPSSDEGAAESVSYSADAEGVSFNISLSPYTEEVPSGPALEPTLRALIGGFATSAGGKVETAREVSVSGRTAVQYLVSIKGGFAHGRLLIHNGRLFLYQAVTASRNSRVAATFLRSFRLTR